MSKVTDVAVFAFSECFLLILYFRILVMDRGEIKEFDSPSTLLKNTKSIFYSMARDANLV